MKRLILVVGWTFAALLLSFGGLSRAGRAAEPVGNARASAVSPPLVGPEFEIPAAGDPDDKGRPNIAYDRIHGNYEVVYHDAPTQTLVSALVSHAGATISVVHSPGTVLGNGMNPDVAYNATEGEYFIVASTYNMLYGTQSITGRRMSWDNLPLGDPFIIAFSATMDLRWPRVAWDPLHNSYMVVWQAEQHTNSAILGVGRRCVTAAGNFCSDDAFFRQVSFPGSPSLAYNVAGDHYLAVWTEFGGGGTSFNIYGAFLPWDGDLTAFSMFPVSERPNVQELADVATAGQDRYLVVWQDAYSASDEDIRGQWLGSSGNLIGGDFYIAGSTVNETRPRLTTSGGGSYLVVWQQTTPSGEAIDARLLSAGGSTSLIAEVAPGGFGNNGNPAVGSNGAGFLVVYQWKPFAPASAFTGLFGRFVTPNQLLLPITRR